MTTDARPSDSPAAQRNISFRAAVTAGLNSTDPAAAYRYGHCREEGFGWWYHCPQNDEHYAAYVPSFCMLRICPDCCQYSANLIQAKYRPVIEHECNRSYRKALKFLTLTTDVQLTNDLGDAIRCVLDNARDLYRELWGDVSGNGALANLEVGPRGLKLHVHMIVRGRYIPQAEISDAWLRISGSSYIVDISEITADKAVKEGLKYITKTVGLTPVQLVSLHHALKGKRRIRSWGCFYKPDIQEDVEERETECPVCQARLRYTNELAYEEWRANNAKCRLEVEMNMLARQTQSLQSLLHLTDANKFFGTGPPGLQISYLRGSGVDMGLLIDDVSELKG